MHEVMYNHQLEYDRWLSDFLKEAEVTLANMRDRIWTAVHALAEGEGMTFKDSLNLTLCILPLLPQIPVDVSYETQIPLIIAYCPESSVYRRWHAEHGGVSPFCKEVRASRTLTKVLDGIHCQNMREQIALHVLLPPKALRDRTCHEAPELGRVAIPEVSPRTAAINQVPPTPRPLKMTRNPSAGLSPPTWKRTPPAMMSTQRFVRVTVKS